MSKIVQLLDEKNHFLEQFYSLGESTLRGFRKGDFSSLEYFYRTREEMLKLVRYVDGQVEKAQSELVEISQDLKDKVKACLGIKDSYVSQILKQDLEVLALLEQEKTSIIRDLQSVQKTRRAVTGYRSRSQLPRLIEEA